MLLHRSGSGGPPVVFLAGGGMSGLYYWNVHDLVAEFTTSVSYDRLGLGWSDVVELPRSGARVTDELRELLRVADVPGPCVLVGHSLGGLYARLHAKRFPDAVAGELMPPEARGSAAEPHQAKHRLYTDLAAALPRAEVRRLDDAGHLGLTWLRAGRRGPGDPRRALPLTERPLHRGALNS